jgi:hypothetical protein
MLANMPDEVFDTWLLPIIKDHDSWPYNDIFSTHPSVQWSQYFGLFTLYDISNLMWDKFNLRLDVDLLDQISDNTIYALMMKHVFNVDATGQFNVRDSKIRFDGFVELIKRTGSIPPPVIGVNTPDGLRILDGNHRLAALTYLERRGQVQCDTWVGHPPK